MARKKPRGGVRDALKGVSISDAHAEGPDPHPGVIHRGVVSNPGRAGLLQVVRGRSGEGEWFIVAPLSVATPDPLWEPPGREFHRPNLFVPESPIRPPFKVSPWHGLDDDDRLPIVLFGTGIVTAAERGRADVPDRVREIWTQMAEEMGLHIEEEVTRPAIWSMAGPLGDDPIDDASRIAMLSSFASYEHDPSDRERYSQAVGARVKELVDQYAADHPGLLETTPPELLAETLVDIAIDPEADRSELADLLAPLWSAKRTQEALGGLSRATMHDRRKTGSVLGVKTTDGAIFYPVAQFEAHGGKVRVKPGLRPFLMALRERDPWTVAVLLHTPADELGGLTPLDWVRKERDVDVLVAYARAVDAEFSR